MFLLEIEQTNTYW